MNADRAYAEHYDATAAKGLCWECETNRVAVSEWKDKRGKVERVASLWCLDCQITLGQVVDATALEA
jgi:hypothetical protein